MSYLFEEEKFKISYSPNEDFTFKYNDKHGVDLEFRAKKKKKKKNKKLTQQ
jgi:hypothetical protein